MCHTEAKCIRKPKKSLCFPLSVSSASTASFCSASHHYFILLVFSYIQADQSFFVLQILFLLHCFPASWSLESLLTNARGPFLIPLTHPHTHALMKSKITLLKATVGHQALPSSYGCVGIFKAPPCLAEQHGSLLSKALLPWQRLFVFPATHTGTLREKPCQIHSVITLSNDLLQLGW